MQVSHFAVDQELLPTSHYAVEVNVTLTLLC